MKRIVIKVGSAVLTEQNRLAKERMSALVEFIHDLRSQYEVILVSSGAVAAGYTELKVDKRLLENRQALASVGQPNLMNAYHKKFGRFDISVAQVLLTADDFDSRKRTDNAIKTIEVLLQNKIVPIINENDVTAIEELVFGDNDRLSAHVAYYFHADMLVILTDIDGYYDKNPKEYSDARMRKIVEKIEDSELAVRATPGSEFATGGITTKLQAADFLMQRGLETYLSSGFDLSCVRKYLLEGNHEGGTRFLPESAG